MGEGRDGPESEGDLMVGGGPRGIPIGAIFDCGGWRGAERFE